MTITNPLVGFEVPYREGDVTALRHRSRIERTQRSENKKRFARSTRLLRHEVLEAARDLFARGDEREFSAVISKRLGLSEATVDRILVALVLEHETWKANHLNAEKNAAVIADEAAQGVWEEFEEMR